MVRIGACEFNIPADKWRKFLDRYTYYSRRDPAAGRTPVLAMRIDLARKQWEMTVRKADLSNLATVGFGELSLFLKIGDTFFGPSIVETSETVNLRWRR